jgi:DNA polymerase
VKTTQPSRALEAHAAEAASCKACDLWECGTQTVFGEGPADAEVVLVGEQPGDQEDRAGRPFVGPAGHVLDDALAAAGIDRDRVYLTNAVKHFKWTPKGKRRIHQSPNRTEIVACSRWLTAELQVLRPTTIVVLGAIAGQALFGSSFRVGTARGADLAHDGIRVVATIHPSAVLRTRTAAERAVAFDGLVADLRRVRGEVSR